MEILKEIKKYSSPQKAQGSLRFFKCGPGQYGEGDKFLGLTNPECRLIAKKYANLTFAELKTLLSSPFHEVRGIALLILVFEYKRTKDFGTKKKIVKFYLANKKAINNWDLVDLTVYNILGDYCFHTSELQILNKLLTSKRHWDRRMAMVSTYYFIKKNNPQIAFDFALTLIEDKEDLMHKACGWMLREAGKKDIKRLEKFIELHGPRMPRTMLRYAIERFPEQKRKAILLKTKGEK